MTGNGLLHGWTALAVAYGAVQGPMLVGLARAKADFSRYLLSPGIAAPLMLIAAAGAAVVAPQGLLRAVVATGLGVALGLAGGKEFARREQDTKVRVRGSIVDDSAVSPRKPTARGDREGGIHLAGIAIPVEDEAKHFKLIGTTGTGKSTAIREILCSALARGDRAVIADPDGGYLRDFYDKDRGDVILNPFDERSVKWDLFAEIDKPYDVEQLARSLIPEHDRQDRIWPGYARTFFTAVTKQAHAAGISDTGELYRLLVVADNTELRALVRGTPAQPFLDEHNSRMFDSIRSVAASATAALEYVAQQKAPSFSVRQWVSQQSPGVLFVPYKANQIAALRSPISAWLRLAIFEAMNRDETPRDAAGKEQGDRLWFVVDELDALGQIDGLKDALARLRKFGGRCVLGFQSIAQVSSTYGQGDAHTIVENCGNTLILRCSASEGGGTAKFASQLIGEREITRLSVSRSRRATEWLGSETRSQHLNFESAVLPAEVEQLADLSGYLKYASDPGWQKVRLQAMQAWQQGRGRPTPSRTDPSRSPTRSREHE